MGDNDGWITRQEMPMPEEGEEVQFPDASGVLIAGFFADKWFRFPTGGTCIHAKHVARWRRLPPKPELPEFVKRRMIRAGTDTAIIHESDLRDLFDTTKTPHLAVVESEEDEPYLRHVIDKLREQMRKERAT